MVHVQEEQKVKMNPEEARKAAEDLIRKIKQKREVTLTIRFLCPHAKNNCLFRMVHLFIQSCCSDGSRTCNTKILAAFGIYPCLCGFTFCCIP